MNVIVRGIKRGRLIFERATTLPDETEISNFIATEAPRHMRAMKEGTIGMVEIEFCDLPENERFLRIGVEPHGMRMPIEIDLTKDPS